MPENNSPVKVKKVQPYPFEVRIERDGKKEKAEALKLVLHGALIDIGQIVLKVGDNLKVEFYLPADHGEIFTDVKVIKTYDHFKGGQEGGRGRRIAEVHFLRHPLPEKDRLKVKEFLKDINQTGTLKK